MEDALQVAHLLGISIFTLHGFIESYLIIVTVYRNK